MRKLFLGFAALIIILSGCGGGEATGASGENGDDSNSQIFELNVNNFGPSTGVFATDIFEPWKELVEEKTEGRVQVNLYHGAALGDAPTVYNDVKGGVYDVGLAWTPYVVDSKFFPLTLGDLPFAGTDDVELNNEIFNKYGQKYLVDAEEDVIVMGIAAGVNNYFFTAEKIETLKELQNKSIRAVGSNEAAMIEAWGAVPVSVSGGELYEGIQRGIIDVSVTAIDSTVDRSLYEVTPYMIDIPIKTIQMVPIMNKSFYDKLPDDLKTLFDEELNPSLTQLVLESNINSEATARERFLELVSDTGGIVQFPEEDVQFLRAESKIVWDNWVSDANQRGYDGEAMLNEYREIIEEAGFSLPFE